MGASRLAEVYHFDITFTCATNFLNDNIIMDSSAREIVLRGQHVVQIALSLYGAAASYVAITNLQKYEATAKKAAEWSKMAETELNKTRFTQASGAIAV